jgi:hypothetical protein
LDPQLVQDLKIMFPVPVIYLPHVLSHMIPRNQKYQRKPTHMTLLGQNNWNNDGIKKRRFVENEPNIGVVGKFLNNYLVISLS